MARPCVHKPGLRDHLTTGAEETPWLFQGGRGQKQGLSCQDLAPRPPRLLLPFLTQPTKCSGLTQGAGVSVPEVHMHVHKRAQTHTLHYFSQGCTLSSLQQAGSFEPAHPHTGTQTWGRKHRKHTGTCNTRTHRTYEEAQYTGPCPHVVTETQPRTS